MMKVVHINTNDLGGGAAIAASRHCEAMRAAGIDAVLKTLTKVSHKPFVKKIHLGLRALLVQLLSLLHLRLIKKLKPTGTFSVMRYGHPFYKDCDVKDADVIFLHWINSNALSIKGVEKILKLGKPTIWYMHDMFPITGGCHHSLGCDGYQKECKACPLVKCHKDLPSKQLRNKIKHWDKYKNLIFVTPSKWLGSCVEKSALAKGHKLHIIPNVIDTELFKPLPFDTKVMFGLDPGKKTLLFSADLSGSVYKGSQYTIKCLKELDPSKYEGLIIGNMPKGLEDIIPIKIIATGYLTDSLSLVLAYNACDTVLISSIAENYPNVILEAMACGRPCLGFNTGGIPDLINNNINGILVFDNTSDGLIDGVDYLFSNDDRYIELSRNARQQVVANNSYSMYAHFIEGLLYEHE